MHSLLLLKLSFIQTLLVSSVLSLCWSPLVQSQQSESQKTELMLEFKAKAGSFAMTTQHLDANQQPLFINRLIQQESLYLLQHANNPVQWWAWEGDAFAQAKALNKPIFLSIGYSTCHWCHVMARESFENLEVASFINQHFIPIKVDREEHPAVDELYLTAVQMLSGKAGWPLTAVLTPDGKAFFGGTYFQPAALLNVLNRIDQTWRQRQDAVLEQANRISAAIQKIGESTADSKAINAERIQQATVAMQQDLIKPFKRSMSEPGFPREPELLFLLNQAQRTLSEDTIDTISHRLLMLASSGLHDHVGGGFHRYTVDSTWVVPHFEKMLYNQAQMARAYFQAYRITRNPVFREVAENTVSFLLNQMQAPEGGFYSAMDAESNNPEGVKGEGEFYLWDQAELDAILTADQRKLAVLALGVTPQGNFNGRTVLQNSRLGDPEVNAILAKLEATRAQRKLPQIDTKIITAWNAMAISTLVTGHQIIDNDGYLSAARDAAERLWRQSYNVKLGLSRTVPVDDKRVAAALEDYAYFANALLDLFDVSGETKWLERAEMLATEMLAGFHDEKTGGFQISRIQSAQEQRTIPMQRLVSARDDATYSGNSMAAQLLARLHQRTGKANYKHKANRVIATFAKPMLTNPEGMSGMLLAANILNNGDIGTKQYAVKGKLVITTRAHPQAELVGIDIEIADGWHINASEVLSDYLIPTQLAVGPEQRALACDKLTRVDYPAGERVKLGFQDDELLVYEGTVRIMAERPSSSQDSFAPDLPSCVMAATLNVQACNDEVCLPPERIQLRGF